MIWGSASGGGGRDRFEVKAKEVEKLINEKGGCVRGGDSPSCADDSKSLSDATPSATPIATHRERESGCSTRLGFERNILSHMSLESERAERRHEEKMELFRLLIEKL